MQPSSRNAAAPSAAGGGFTGRKLLVATSFDYDDGIYPNFKRRDRLGNYWKNIAAMMATARRFAPADTHLVVFSTDPPTPEVERVLRRLDVRLESPPFAYRPPKGFYHAFPGAFYLFDAMAWCAVHPDLADTFLFLDPDVLVAGDLGPMLDALETHECVVYRLTWPLSRQNNGVTPEDLQQVFAEMSGRPCPAPPTFWGAEMLTFGRAGLDRLVAALPDIWADNLARFQQGKTKLNTEEHVLAYWYWRDRPRMQDALGLYVKRFWTGYTYRNCYMGEDRLPIWHLPGEKARGMLRIFDRIAAHPDLFDRLPDPKLHSYLSKSVGLRGAWVRQSVFGLLKATGRAFPGVP